jgi:hypothetical protein
MINSGIVLTYATLECRKIGTALSQGRIAIILLSCGRLVMKLTRSLVEREQVMEALAGDVVVGFRVPKDYTSTTSI